MSIERFFSRKPIDNFLHESTAPTLRLKRTLGRWQLAALGIGATVGAGIFSSIGTAVAGSSEPGGHLGAGPALVISLLLVTIACGFAALCYAEFAAMVPLSGSAYTYAYATLGELIAWIIGWDLIIEYAIGNVAVAISWSAYFQELLRGFNLAIPNWLGVDFRSASQAVQRVAEMTAAGETPGAGLLRAANAFAEAPRVAGLPLIFNLPAFGIVMLLTWILVLGIRESARFNSAMVILKLLIVGFFLAVGAMYVKPENWTPFAPNGFAGISGAAAIIFFAYIGFDAVSTAAEETVNPQRNMPFGIIASLIACTVLYVGVAIVLTGLMPSKELGSAEPLAAAFSSLGLNWAAGIISLGAVVATTSVLFVFQLGQPRIFFSMARDGLLPQWAARVHPKYQTPHVTTWLTGIFVALFAGVANLDEVVELCNIGTLFAFVLVAVGVLVLRRTDPDRPRPFRIPFGPWVPLGAVISCGYLMFNLPAKTWWRFAAWLGIGLVIYFVYGMRNSRLREANERARADEKK